MSPTARSLRYLRSHGWEAQVVERWIPRAKVRQDCFGIGDILLMATGVIGLVQVTTAAHLAERETKVRAHPNTAKWLHAGGRLWVHGWAKRGERGKRKVWHVTEREIAG